MATIREAAGAAKAGPGRIKLTLITPGKGASGTYTTEVLEQAAADKVWPRGTQSHINHDSEFDRMERPEGNLRNLVGVLLEDAYVDTDGSLVAEARVSSAWRDFVDEFGEFIGASIVASAKIIESKDGPIVERLIPSPFNRVDLVTVAGRGGRIAEVLEAANTVQSRSIVRETTANDIDGYLRAAVRDAHKTEETYAWLQDYDDSFVYFEKSGRTWRQEYNLNGVDATLAGLPVEVHRRVEYDPVTPAANAATDSPANPAGVHENKKEAATMATTQIEEAELATLRESASRAVTVEAELAEAKQKLAAAESATTKATAERIIAEAFGETEAKVTRRALLAEALGTETFDPEALKANAAEAAAEIAVTNGAGTPRRVGETVTATESGKTYTDDDVVNAL